MLEPRASLGLWPICTVEVLDLTTAVVVHCVSPLSIPA